MARSKQIDLFQKVLKKTSPIYVLALFGCGGGGEGSSGDTLSSSLARVFGTVVKGPLQNATVFLDANNNGVQDFYPANPELDEQSTITAADGTFEFTQGNQGFSLVVLTDANTVDLSSGKSIGNVTLKAAAGSSVVTPITTMAVETGLTSDQIAKALGLPETVSYSSFNPYAAGVDNNVAVAVENVGHKIISTITTFANVLKSNSELTQEAALSKATDAMTVLIQDTSLGSGVVDLSTAAGVATYTNKLETAAGVTFTENVRSSTNEAIAAVNAQIDKIEFITVEGAAGSTAPTPTGYSTRVYALVEDLRTQATNNTITFNDQTDFAAAIGDKAPSNIELATYKFDSTHDLISAPILSADGMVGTFKTTDALSIFETDTQTAFSYALSGADGSKFQIINSQQLIYAFNPAADVQKNYDVTVTSTDEGGQPFAKTFVITDHPITSVLGKVSFNQWDVAVAPSPHFANPFVWTGSTSINAPGQISFKIPEYSYSQTLTVLAADWQAFQTDKLATYAAADFFTPGLAVPIANLQYRELSRAVASMDTNGQATTWDRTIEVRASSMNNDAFDGFSTTYFSETNPSMLWLASPGATDGTLIISGDVKASASAATQISFSIQEIKNYSNTSQNSGTYDYAKTIDLATQGGLTKLANGDYSEVVISVTDPNNPDALINIGVTDVGYFADTVSVPQENIRYSVDTMTSNGGVSVTLTASSAYTPQQLTEVVLDNQIETYRSSEKAVILSDRYYSVEEVITDATGTLTTDTVKTLARDTFLISDYAVNGYFSYGITVSEADITPIFSDPASNGQVSVALTGKWVEAVQTVNQYGSQFLGITDDTFLVAWTQKSLVGQDCYGQFFLADGSQKAEPFLISAQPYETASQSIFLTPDAFTAFSKDAYTGISIFADGVSVDANNINIVFSTPDLIGNVTATLKAAWPSIANVTEHSVKLSALGADKFIASWTEESGTSSNIKAKIYNIDGTVSVPQFDINVRSQSDLDIAHRINYDPVIQETTDGFLCVWLSYDALGEGPSMMARSFDLQGLPKPIALAAGANAPTVSSFLSSYSEYNNVNTQISLVATVDDPGSVAGTALTLTLNSGAVVTLARDSTTSPLFKGSYKIGIDDVSVPQLDYDRSKISFNTNQRLLFSDNTQQDKYGDVFTTDVYGKELDKSFSFDVSVDGAFSVETSGNKVAIVYTSVAERMQNPNAQEIFMSGFDLSDRNWANSFENNQTLLSDAGLTMLNTRPETTFIPFQDANKVAFSAAWEARPVLTAADTFNFELMSQVYSKDALSNFTSGRYIGDNGLRSYMNTEDFAGLDYDFSPYKKLAFTDKLMLVDQIKLDTYLASFGTDIYQMEASLEPIAAPVAGFSQNGHSFDEVIGELKLAGADFNTLLGEGLTTLTAAQFDWSKLYWDIDGTGANRVQFDTSTDIETVTLEANLLTVKFTAGGQSKLVGTLDFGGNILNNSGTNSLGLTDAIDINAGFLKDVSGNIVLERSVILENGSVDLTDAVDPTLAQFQASAGAAVTDAAGTITGTEYQLSATFETNGVADQMRSGTQFKAKLQDGTEVVLTQADATALNTFSGTFIIAGDVAADNGQTWQEGIKSYENVSAVDTSGNAFKPQNKVFENFFLTQTDGVIDTIYDVQLIM